MDPIKISTGDAARLGGVDLTISLTPAQAAALGADAQLIADWTHTALWAVAAMRTQADTERLATPDGWHTALNDVGHRLLPRLEGVRDALIRAHAAAGGTYGDLALALDAPRSSAQYRRDTITNRPRPTQWEDWATAAHTDTDETPKGI